MKNLLIVIFMLAGANKASAKEYSLLLDHLYSGDFLKVEEMYIETKKYDTYRNAYLPEEKKWNFSTEFHNNLSIFEKGYLNTNLHMSMDESQIRYAGLQYTLGAKLLPWLHAVKYHHSSHVLEKDVPGNKVFPVEDSYGIRIYFKK
jgi:hypothetical protein